MSEKDLDLLWEEDGDLDRMKTFFQSFAPDNPKKERIKELTLAKLAEGETLASSQSEKHKKESRLGAWRKRLKGISLGYKLVVPAALLLIILVGYQATGAKLFDWRVGSSPKGVSVENSRQAAEQQKREPNMSNSGGHAPYYDLVSPILPVPQTPPADPGVARKITQDLSVVMQVDDVWSAIDTITKEVQSSGGYVVEAQQNGSGNSSSGHITVKIPAAKLDGFKAALPSWGKVLEQHLTTNDITNQYYDAETRLASWESEQKRYLEILQQAKNVDDILKVENALANIRQQIEQLKGQLKLWNNQVDYSTVRFQLQSQPVPDVQVNDPWHPIAWSKTWTATKNAVLKTISGTWNAVNYLIVGLGYAFPFLFVTLLGWLGYRFWKRNRT